jgi:hypothetical protein
VHKKSTFLCLLGARNTRNEGVRAVDTSTQRDRFPWRKNLERSWTSYHNSALNLEHRWMLRKDGGLTRKTTATAWHNICIIQCLSILGLLCTNPCTDAQPVQKYRAQSAGLSRDREWPECIRMRVAYESCHPELNICRSLSDLRYEHQIIHQSLFCDQTLSHSSAEATLFGVPK